MHNGSVSGRGWTAIGGVMAIVILAAACSSSSNSSSSATTAAPTTPSTAAAPTTAAPTTTAIPQGSGPVDVLYAASLEGLMNAQIAPAFHTATGYTFTGFPAGSAALAAQIKSKVRQGDVFISASPTVNATLQGEANGNWVSWYATFATSPLVLGYNPNSKFAADLKSKPWYQVIAEPGLLLGRTDPATDPKGKLAVQALNNAAAADNEPALKTIATDKSNVFAEESLVARMKAGQLDAGFFYASEAKAAGIPTVPLTGQTLKATYTVTVLNMAPHAAGGEAFVAYLLGPATSVLSANGYTLVTPPKVTGTGVPAGLQSTLGASS